MKLFYFKHFLYDNVGDDLNEWMWSQLLPPGFLDEGTSDRESDTLLVGIGTLLNDLVPKARRTLVFGSGVGYGGGLPAVDDSWRFYCVRGPLSSERLGISPASAVTDGAALLRRLVRLPERKKRYPFSYMPHAEFSHYAGSSWEKICQDLGYGYISATWPFERILGALAETDVLITEAMHGAIIADTMRVPWIAAQSSPIINPFKWEDWTRSVGVEYSPNLLATLWEHPRFTKAWWKYTLKKPHAARMQQASRRLKQAALARPQLSRETTLDALVDTLEERLHRLASDFARPKAFQLL